jgi:FixJ family two-component response regulator
MLHTQPRPPEIPETVFIVDDDEAVRDSLQWLIETEGYQVRTFEDPEIFLAQLQWPQPCVLLLDIRMPKMSESKYRRFSTNGEFPFRLFSSPAMGM